MLRGIINSTSTLFTQIWFYNLIQGQILLAAPSLSVLMVGLAKTPALLCLLVCIQLLMNWIHRWKDAVNYLVCSEQGICRIIGDYTTKILVNEMGKEKLTL